MLFKPFSEVTTEDYAAVGLRCGLEVHQQLLTRHKLFCRCPAGCYSDAYDAVILRHMRPTLSELGEYDGTALMEKKTKKNIYYRIRQETVCTYEFDDTPPFFIDDEALDIAIEIAQLCNLQMVGEMHIARKQYLDGSIPTGFQRTAIIGVGGWIPYRDRRIGVRQLSIEEDACREVSDVGHDRVYLTDRLGMPLIEVVTEPEMRTPQEIAEVCQIIRSLCRSTGRVRTGYGAGREDVNVSVRGGTRIEIKGVPQITRIPLLVHNEARRQCSLLHIREMLRQRGVTADTFQAVSFDVARAVSRADYQPIREALAAGQRVMCVVLKGFAGILNEQTQEQTTFAKEFSDRVRVIACLTRLPNIVHSDTASDLLTVRDWKDVRKRTGAGDADGMVLVWGSEDDTRTACNEIILRALEATKGVPSDTRQALKDGTNGFERVLPGAERMYPDTDLPPMAITHERIERIRRQLPERVWDRQVRYRAMRVPGDAVEPLSFSSRAALFERIVTELDVDPVFAAVIVVQRFKAWRRDGFPVDRLRDDDVFEVFREYSQGRLTREAVREVLRCLLADLQGTEPDDRALATLLGKRSRAPLTDSELDLAGLEYLRNLDGRRFHTVDQKVRFTVGELMRTHWGRIEGIRAAAWLGDKLKFPQHGVRGNAASTAVDASHEVGA